MSNEKRAKKQALKKPSTMADEGSSKKKSSKTHRSGGDVSDDEPPLDGYER